MKIVVAPDSFKGSISAREFCASVQTGVRRIFPQASVVGLPLADGGEGTMENLVFSTGGSSYTVKVMGPLGKPVLSTVGILGDKETVVIEMAQASGLPLVSEKERNPLITTSYGTGELIKHALDNNYRKFIIGLGGSATNDGGTGMLRALGVKFYAKDGEELPDGGGALSRLNNLDDTSLDPRIKESSFIIASDVTNQLCGTNGASCIFGPQKGATPDMVVELDQALLHYSNIVKKQKGVNLCEINGGGAAGGMGAALVAFLQATVQSGIDVVMDAIQFSDQVKDATLIITGEGKLDNQTLSGKVIAGVSHIAKSYHIPVVALCGGLELTGEQMDELGIIAAFSIVPGPCSLATAMENSSEWTVERTEQIMRLLKVFS